MMPCSVGIAVMPGELWGDRVPQYPSGWGSLGTRIWGGEEVREPVVKNRKLSCLEGIRRPGDPPSSSCPQLSSLPKTAPPFYYQALPRGLRMHQGWAEPQLWLHQLRHLQLGLPGSLPSHDAGLLGEPFPAGTDAPTLPFGPTDSMSSELHRAHP